MKITLKDGSCKEYAEPMAIIDIAKDISEGLARVACVAELDGEVVDLRTVVDGEHELNILTFDSDAGKAAYRHTASHVLAQAIKRLYPHAKCAIGPAIDDGFYYDFDMESLDREALDKIEKEMKKVCKEGKKIYRREISKAEALELFKDDEYKLDLIDGLEDGNISVYDQGDFTDLCRGPHVDNTKLCKNFKLIKYSGVYWKGDANNKMLQRVYGICFDTKEELEAHLEALEEAKKRDHKKLGKEMGLFTISEFAPGMPIFLPDGMILRNILEQYWYQEHTKEGYQFIKTPIMMSKELWELSGHWDHYKEDMFVLTDADGNEQALKPMNCPNSIKIYQSKLRSYKDLPLRFNDVDVIHRNEKSGQLNGLFRVRMFRQDDSHNYITEEQIGSEIKDIIEIAKQLYSVFGLEYKITLSTRPEEDFMGEIETWDKAENDLRKVLDEICGEGNYQVNEGD